MKRVLLLVLMIVGLFPSPQHLHALIPTLTIIRSQTDIQITATLPPLTVRSTPNGAQLTLTDWPNSMLAGAPALPQHTLLIAVPHGYSARLAAFTAHPAQTLQLRPQPAPTFTPANPEQPARLLTEYHEDHFAYGKPFPSAVVQLGEPVQIRDQVLVSVTLTAAQWQPHGQIQTFDKLTAQIDFVADPHASPPRPDPLWEQSLRSLVINPEVLPARKVQATRPTTPPLIQLVRLSVNAPGLYRLPLNQLPTAWSTISAVRLFQGQQEIPRLVDGSDLLFYVPPFATVWSAQGGLMARYTPDQNALIPAQRVVQPPSGSPLQVFSATTRIEDQTYYISHDPQGDDQDHWWGHIWTRSGANPAPPIVIAASLPNADLSRAGAVRVRLHGGAQGNQHRISVAVNGVLVGNVEWSGRTLKEATFPISAGILGLTNTITLQALAADGALLERGYVDWIELEYARPFVANANRLQFAGAGGSYSISNLTTPAQLWDITTPHMPQILTGQTSTGNSLAWNDSGPRRYLVQSRNAIPQANASIVTQPDLRATSNRADYLAISNNVPASSQDTTWLPKLQPLLEQRQAQGLVPMSIDVQWLYDQFGTGHVDPQAIRAFIAFAFANWTAPAPSYVLLVGDGSNDPRFFSGFSTETNFLPPYLSYSDPWLGETAADNRYVTIAGNDDLPDLHIGRFPARSAAEVTTMVSKTLHYEASEPTAAWLKRVLLVADNPDSAGDFHALTNALTPQITPPYTFTTHLYSSQDPATFRTALVTNINQGALFVNYIGHAGIDVWGEAPTLYSATEINQLTNIHTLPIMLPMTCFAGYFQDSGSETLAELELRRAAGGAVASWSPTGLGIATGHDYLNRGILDAVLHGGVRSLGPATLAGKLRLFQQGFALDLLNTYLIIGDPALRIPLPAQAPTAVADAYTIAYNSNAQILPVLTNDTDPYSATLQITQVTQPLHGMVEIDSTQQTLVYTPAARYYGPDFFTYTTINPSNRMTATAQVEITLTRPPGLVFLPFVMR